MIAPRSAVYHAAFYVNLAIFCIAGLPLFVLPRRWGSPVMRLWARSSIWLLKGCCDLTYEVRGSEHIPKGGALVAAKHQSAWETISFLYLLPDPSIVLKRELAYLPLFGWYAVKFGNLALNRTGGAAALRALVRGARAAVLDGRQVVIFPEGTRRAPGAPPDYHRGVIALYRDLGVPCVPIALNSGLFWPRRSMVRRPGRVVVEFLPAIPPGLGGRDFLAALEAAIEPATARLVAEGRSGTDSAAATNC